VKRDEVERLEAAVHGANPVPLVPDLIHTEEAAAVTLLVEQRRRTMTTTPTQTPPQATGSQPTRRRSIAWAFAAGFVLVVLVVGAAALFLRGDNLPRADEPAPPETAAITAADNRELATVAAGWQRIGDPWLESEPGSMEPLPDGGFVAAALSEHPAGSRVMWSPDGLNWYDGDPQRLLPPRGVEMAVIGDQVIILAGEDDTPADLWIGNPKTGNWAPMVDLDTTGLEGQLVPWTLGMSAGTDEALVAAVTAAELPVSGDDPVEVGVVVWLVDPGQGTATRANLPVDIPATITWPTTWFDGRWHIMMPLTLVDYYWVETGLWSSVDGTTWTEDELPAGWQFGMLHAPTVGSSGIVTCATIDGIEETAGAWHSPNGVDWHWLGPTTLTYCRGVYSDTLGFVLERGGKGFTLLAPDGTQLETLDSPFDADTVAASGNNLIVDAYRGSEYSAEESAGYRGLWLYHQPDDR
jgi:hypothetical protein